MQEIAADVPLGDLREIVNSAYFDEDLRFCGLLSKLIDDRLRHQYNANFLLEIWTDGVLVYALPLKQGVRAWSASRQANSLIFLLDEDDEY